MPKPNEGNNVWGVRHHDGSVSHPWNGRTAEDHARNCAERLAHPTYPELSPVVVKKIDGKWIPATGEPDPEGEFFDS